MAEGMLEGGTEIPSLMTMRRTAGASYLADRKALGGIAADIKVSRDSRSYREREERDTDNKEAQDAARAAAQAEAEASYTGTRTKAQSLGAMKEAISFENPVVQKAFQYGLTAVAPPLGMMYGAVRTGLGAMASLAESVEEGAIGDVMGSRAREAERDALERSGYGYGTIASMADIDRQAATIGFDSAFGLSTGYAGTTAGQLGAAAAGTLGDPGSLGVSGDFGMDVGSIGRMGGEAGVSAGNVGDFDMGIDEGTDVSGFGDIGDVGTTSRGGLSGSLGDDAAGGGGGDSEGAGADSGGHGARGGGDEGTSEAGGIGGY